MKKKSLYFALLLGAATLMVSCEHISTIEKRFVNSSSHAATLVYVGGESGVESDSIVVPAGTEATFLTWDEIGTNDAPACLENVSSVHIMFPDSSTLLKDPATEANWSNTTVKLSRGEYKHTCSFTLTDADLQ